MKRDECRTNKQTWFGGVVCPRGLCRHPFLSGSASSAVSHSTINSQHNIFAVYYKIITRYRKVFMMGTDHRERTANPAFIFPAENPPFPPSFLFLSLFNFAFSSFPFLIPDLHDLNAYLKWPLISLISLQAKVHYSLHCQTRVNLWHAWWQAEHKLICSCFLRDGKATASVMLLFDSHSRW